MKRHRDPLVPALPQHVVDEADAGTATGHIETEEEDIAAPLGFCLPTNSTAARGEYGGEGG
jgi:hypothetical protein